MSNSKLVVASKYELQIPDGLKSGRFKTAEASRKFVNKKLVDRIWVNFRINSGVLVDDNNKVIDGIRSNNELYVLHEDETKEAMAKRDVNIINNAEQKKKEGIGMHELVDAITKNMANTGGSSGNVPSVHFTDSMSLQELKAYCDKNNIEYHHKAGESKLIELIKS